MSRNFTMFVRVSGADPNRTQTVQQSAAKEWPFEGGWHEQDGVLTCSADGQLCGGESDDQFAQKLALAIWAANGSFCQVEVQSTYLDDLPYESYGFEQSDYDRLASPA